MAGIPASASSGPFGAWELSRRRVQPELMDDPGLEPARHARALEALARINRVSLVVPRVLRTLRRVHERRGRGVRVLDVACGGGDVLAALGRAAERAGIPVELAACDRSAFALEHTRTRCGAHVSTYCCDVLKEELPVEADLVLSNLFLHHLEETGVERVLASMARAAADTLLVQDLRRTTLGYLFAWVGLHTLTRSDVARTDGLRSVRAAFSMDEVRLLCERAGLGGAAVRAVWPQRFELSWRPAP